MNAICLFALINTFILTCNAGITLMKLQSAKMVFINLKFVHTSSNIHCAALCLQSEKCDGFQAAKDNKNIICAMKSLDANHTNQSTNIYLKQAIQNSSALLPTETTETPTETTEPSETPTETSEIPTETPESPTETSETPETPTETSETTTETSEIPTETSETPETPTETSETPTETSETPTETSETTTETSEIPTETSEIPTETTEPSETPTETSETTTETSEIPTETSETPTETSETPSETTEPSETPTETSETPTETSETTTETSEIPTETTEPSETPTETSETTTETSEIPTETSETPTETSETPTETPTETTETPTETTETPTETTETPTETTETPTETTETPTTPFILPDKCVFSTKLQRSLSMAKFGDIIWMFSNEIGRDICRVTRVWEVMAFSESGICEDANRTSVNMFPQFPAGEVITAIGKNQYFIIFTDSAQFATYEVYGLNIKRLNVTTPPPEEYNSAMSAILIQSAVIFFLKNSTTTCYTEEKFLKWASGVEVTWPNSEPDKLICNSAVDLVLRALRTKISGDIVGTTRINNTYFIATSDKITCEIYL